MKNNITPLNDKELVNIHGGTTRSRRSGISAFTVGISFIEGMCMITIIDVILIMLMYNGLNKKQEKIQELEKRLGEKSEIAHNQAKLHLYYYSDQNNNISRLF